MGLFSKKKPRTYQKRNVSPEQRQDRLERKKAWESFTEQMKKDPDLEQQFVFKTLGIEPKKSDPTEKKRAELRNTLIEEAVKLISEDPEVRRNYAEGMIGEVLGKSLPKQSRQQRNDNYYDDEMLQPGSSISQAIDELDSLSELKEKLSELGMGNGSKKNGFFDGLTMKDIVNVLQVFQGNQPGSPAVNNISEPLYIVQVDGKPTKVTEQQYNTLLSQGRIRPVAELIEPRKEEALDKETTQTDEGIQPVIGRKEANTIPLDTILEYVDIKTLEEYLNLEPDEFVEFLQLSAQDGDKSSQFLWGLLSNTTYENIMELLGSYKNDERISVFIEKIEQDENKQWMEHVINKIKEIQREGE